MPLTSPDVIRTKAFLLAVSLIWQQQLPVAPKPLTSTINDGVSCDSDLFQSEPDDQTSTQQR
ncbi:MAG: hypothetical protein AB8B64_26760 [Granulosicoccus sp.]